MFGLAGAVAVVGSALDQHYRIALEAIDVCQLWPNRWRDAFAELVE
jgi:hypothetical protein